jgi:hypothetical protein
MDSNTEPVDDPLDTIPKRILAHVVMVLLGPLMFGGELVGPLGGVAWRQIAYGLLGTAFWAFVIFGVVQFV